MAPNRKRGAGKAAAAAAARKQWKVGDLVLAKVKGFPAWPATVSEPEKWGYSTDWKKVLVHFFGTKQIAFCNPVDVEAFTEEKKKSLLIKLQGKGADFVRAVQEIIDCYEKSKKQDRVDGENLGDEGGAVSNAGNFNESMGNKSGKKVQTQSSVAIPSPTSETMCTSAERNESRNPIEVPAASKEFVDLNEMETLSEEPVETASSLDHFREATLGVTKSLRKRSRDNPLQSCVPQKRVAVRRSRSTSRVDPGGSISNVMREESISRNKQIRKSPDKSVWHDLESPGYSTAFVSNVSIEDNGSEIVATNSDTISLNEGSTLESSCKTERPDIEYVERDVQLRARLHPQAKTVVLKKKRKPNRKRVAHDAVAHTSSPVKESGLEVLVSKTVPKSPDALKKMNDPSSKADGDEHLPLVKRARVRMGKPPTEEELNDLVDAEEKSSKEVLMNHSDPASSSFGCVNNDLTERTSLDIRVARNSTSPPNGCTHTENEPQFWKAKKYQLRGCSVDGEAALPPSKRLHRALEAMSANAVEDGQAYVDETKGTTKMISSNCFKDLSEKSSSHISMDNKAGNGLEVRNVNSSGDDDDTYLNGISGPSPGFTLPTSEVSEKTSSRVKPSDHIVSSSICPSHEDCKETAVEARRFGDLKNLDDSSINTQFAETEIHIKSPGPPYNFDEKQGGLESSRDSQNLSSPSMKEDKHDIVGPSNRSPDEILKDSAYSQEDKSDKEDVTSPPNHQRLDSVLEAEEADKFTTQNGIGALLANGDPCKNTNPLSSPSNEKVKGMCEVMKEVELKSTQKDIDDPPYEAFLYETSPNETSMKVLIAAAQAKRHLSLDDKAVRDDVSSPSLMHTVDSYDQAVPSNPMIIPPSTMYGNSLLHNCNGGTDVLSIHKKATHALEIDEERNSESSVFHRQKSLGKCTNADANAAKKSFESMLETLSRTKESIGRATRVAIDCAKYGIAGEVLEILVRKLESESSFHRRVDLFFLVDSITQCSRGQKGDVGDIYPSAVQAVLPRLLSAAAPPGSAARENRRQCLKVLRLWLERKTLPESIIRHHMRELDSSTDVSFSSAFSRRPLRTERSLNDPIREMEGMLVDEYGSNASFQLPGFFMPRMLEDEEESDADEKSFEAVTPEQDPPISLERETTPTSTIEKHHHILEDVDGELEMEDVAPSCEVHVTGVDTMDASLCQSEQHIPSSFAPPLPEDLPPSPPPLPASPPPMVPPPPPPSAMSRSFSDTTDSNLYMSRHSLPNHFHHHVPQQQPDTSSVNSSTTLDTIHYYAPGATDVAIQMQRPSMQAAGNNNIQQMDGAPALLSKSYHLQPPPPTLSNQFSYVQADHQRMQSWTEASSSRFQFGHDVRRESIYDNRDRMELIRHDIGERSRVCAAPVHPGPAHCENTEASYAPVSYYGPPPRAPSSQILSRGWSFPPPRTLNYMHPTPLRPPPENTIPRANGVPNFWRPR